MMFRLMIGFLFTLVLSGQAWACSCAPWSGHVSEFTEGYISVWGVPTAATLETKWDKDRSYAIQGVTYKLEILEGFDRIIQTNINVSSSVPDGANCGVALTLGIPRFISAYRGAAESYGMSTCTPNLPYKAVKLYLETGEDTYIPEWSDCYRWPEDQTDYTPPPIFNEESAECAVWKGVYYGNPVDASYEDLKKYRKIWWEKIKLADPEKKRRWWHFKKDQ